MNHRAYSTAISGVLPKSLAFEAIASESAEYTVPVSRSAADQIEALRRQASGRFLSAAQPGVFTAESRQAAAAVGKRTFREAE